MLSFENMEHAFNRPRLDFENNDPVCIFKGEISLRSEGDSITVENGDVRLDWLPKPRISFEGEVINASRDLMNNFAKKWEIFYQNALRGTGIITSLTVGGSVLIQGVITEEVDFGASCAVDEVHFSLVNFPGRLGDKIVKYGNRFERARLEVGMGQCVLTIDAVDAIKARIKSLSDYGGYNLTHHCRLVFNKSTPWEEVQEHIESIRLTLRILAGQDLGFAFIECFRSDVLQFKLCLHGQVTQILKCYRLCNSHMKLSDSNFFLEIFERWVKGKTDVPLKDLVHWYNMSNSNQGYAEGSLVLAQIGTELLFNWVIREHLGAVTMTGADKLNAAQKLDRLFQFSGFSIDECEIGGELRRYSESENVRVAKAITDLRNWVIHSKLAKREKLNSYEPIIYFQARNVLLFIIERYLIALGGYEGPIFNRLKNDFSHQEAFKIPR